MKEQSLKYSRRAQAILCFHVCLVTIWSFFPLYLQYHFTLSSALAVQQHHIFCQCLSVLIICNCSPEVSDEFFSVASHSLWLSFIGSNISRLDFLYTEFFFPMNGPDFFKLQLCKRQLTSQRDAQLNLWQRKYLESQSLQPEINHIAQVLISVTFSQRESKI